LVDPEGYRRWIPDPETYNNLFRDWNGIYVDINTRNIAERAALSRGAQLVRPVNEPPVYLVSNGIKRWITSPVAMDKYYFDWGKVLPLSRAVVDGIPDGPSWS